MPSVGLYGVVRTDNFMRSGESPGHDETWLIEYVTEYEAIAVCKRLNALPQPDHPDYYLARPMTYTLVVFKP